MAMPKSIIGRFWVVGRGLACTATTLHTQSVLVHQLCGQLWLASLNDYLNLLEAESIVTQGDLLTGVNWQGALG